MDRHISPLLRAAVAGILVSALALTFASCEGTEVSSEKPVEKEVVTHLKNEKSPYLLQHADNLVEWYPWGDEPFERAKKENKPVLLSIGYSTCHWCTVFEEESFTDPVVAKLMNEAFINVLVDREERPDLDKMYMTVSQMMTGSGGWPLNIVMTPDRKPFFTTTYVPKENRFGRTGMLELIPRIREVWETRNVEVNESADNVTSALAKISTSSQGDALGKAAVKSAYEKMASEFDGRNGGFGDAPKFPLAHNFTFLLRYWYRTGEVNALSMVEKSLEAMRLGGVYDHIGYGFHRYSTDDEWLLPHFEKMLHDQAMMAMAYTEAYQATGKSEYAKTAKEIFTYVLRDMTAPDGGFYSAEDSGSDGVEGKFYYWRVDEIRKIFEKDEAEFLITLFNLKPEGNFVDPLEGGKTGENIFHLKKTPMQMAIRLKMPADELEKKWQAARKKLYDLRKKRHVLLKDDKILTNWNGLMIAAFAKAARVFNEPKYLEAAADAADFILANLRDSNGRLLHRYRDGQAAYTGMLNDYVFLTWGLLELYETSFDTNRLRTALELTRDTIKHFWDEKEGGLFFTADDAEKLLVRQKETMDGPIPAGNSVAMLNMLRLGRALVDVELEEKAAIIEKLGSKMALQVPQMHSQLMVASEFAIGPSFEVVIAGKEGAGDTDKMLDSIGKLFVPNKVVLFRPMSDPPPDITKLAEFTKNQIAQNGKATAYVCVNYNCNLPTSDIDKMVELLKVRQPPEKG